MPQLGQLIAVAVSDLRELAGSPTSRVVVLVPKSINGVLARRQLALAGPILRVDFVTVEELLRERGSGPLHRAGLRLEPDGWATSTLRSWLRGHPPELGRFAQRLAHRGWAEPLSRALATLEAEGVTPDHLTRVGSEHAEVLAAALTVLLARRTEEHLASSPMLWEAATRGESPLDEAEGVVLLDVHRVPSKAVAALRPWLAQRPVTSINLTGGADLVDPINRLELEPSHDWQLAATPDEVRECREAVRAVQDATRQGVPLDQIAIALPDASHVESLRAHLEDARVPCRFLIGAPLARQPAARLLSTALDLVEQPTKAGWYALVRFPGLRLHRHLGPDAATGRTSWRGYIAQAPSTGRHLEDALRHRLPDLTDAGQAAVGMLLRAMRLISKDLAPWSKPARLEAHVARWSDFLNRWLGSSSRELTDQLSQLEGPRVSLTEAREHLDELLGRRTPEPALGRAVLVADCEALLGGAFQRVFLLGATEGRLPRKVRQDPLLPDDLVEALNGLGFGLESTADRRRAERRRFQAVRTATTGCLWASVPRFEMVEGRPRLPSSLLLESHGPTWRDLASKTTRAGSRAWTGLVQPRRATDDAEWLLCLPRQERAAQLSGDRWASRLLRYHLAVHRVSGGGVPGPWTGRVPSGLVKVPGFDKDPTHPSRVGRLYGDLGGLLMRQLGAWPAPLLIDEWDPTARRTMVHLQLKALAQDASLPDALDRVLDREAEWRELGDARLELARAMLHARTVRIDQGTPATSDSRLGPLHVSGEAGWLEDDALNGVVGEIGKDPPATLLVQALALGVDELVCWAPDGRKKSWSPGGYKLQLQVASACVERGWFPFRSGALPEDPVFEPIQDWLDVLGRLS